MKALTLVELARRMGASVPPDPTEIANIVELDDGSLLKLFRRETRLTSLRRSRARQFARCACRLRQRGFSTVDVLEVVRVPEIDREGVIYTPLPGVNALQLVVSAATSAEMLDAFARLAARLHREGVYFRGLHLGNVIRGEGGTLGLIDVADVSFSRSSLGVAKRVRNFGPILRYPEQVTAIRRHGPARFIGVYTHASDLSCRAETAMLTALRAKHALFADLPVSLPE